MKIARVEIENFRSIKKASFRLSDVTAVVGENNAGKTAVLRAINAVMNYKYEMGSFYDKQHQFAPKTITRITVIFTDVKEHPRYNGRKEGNELKIKLKFTYSSNKAEFCVLASGKEEKVDENFMAELSEDVAYVYIPAGRTNKDVLWTENSILRELVINYAESRTKNRDNISPHVKRATTQIKKSVLVDLEKKISKLYMQNKRVDFGISFPESMDYSTLMSQIELSMVDHGSSYILKEWGSGTKSLATIAMHRANALLKERDIVLGIEEPETNLHPQAQKRFIQSLQEQLEKFETQTLLTTHSTVLINELHHDQILLIRRVADSKRGFISTATQLPDNFLVKYNLNEFKNYQYFNYKNSDFFFAKYVILGESKVDCQVFEKLVAKKLKGYLPDISFLDAGGVLNLKYPYFLLKELKIPFMTIVDKDFFFNYKVGNELGSSRNKNTGLPEYDGILKSDPLLDDLFYSDELRKSVEMKNKAGYRKFFDLIKSHGILAMNYCLEMDLTCSEKARQLYYDKLKIDQSKRSQKTILIECSNAIKKSENILEILDTLPHASLPEGYSKIKTEIIADVMKNMA